MKRRALKSKGRCSVCGKEILARDEKVVHIKSPKHRKMITLCDWCIGNINDLTGEEKDG